MKIGFSLIELLVVMSIMGILAGMAYPSYQNHLHRARRTEAFLGLSMAKVAIGRADFSSRLAAINQQLQFYNIRHTRLSNGEYQLDATPLGAQRHDSCGTLSLSPTHHWPTNCWPNAAK